MVAVRRRRDVASPDRAALARERAALVARLRELDRLLGNRRETAVVTPPETRGR